MAEAAKRRHIGAFELGKTLGEGAFGKVKLGTNIFTNEEVAVKIISLKNVKSKKEKFQIKREREILLRLQHPNIVNLLKVFDDEKRGKTFMMFEYVSGGELFDYIVAHGRLQERDARKFMRQIVSAVEYCHSLMIVHRDLKPENLLLDKHLNIKISDFGLSNIMEPGKRFQTFCGSLHYACPEILRGESYLGPGVDIWSMGIVLYCLVVGRQPWDGANAEELIHGILEEGLEVPQGISDECVNLILSMLRVSEEDRITISRIRYHPWIVEGYDGAPPESYLPKMDPVTEVDDDVIAQLVEMGFLFAHEDPLEELQSPDRTQLVVTYNLLLEQVTKARKQKAEEHRKRKERKALKKSARGPLGSERHSAVEERRNRSKSPHKSKSSKHTSRSPHRSRKDEVTGGRIRHRSSSIAAPSHIPARNSLLTKSAEKKIKKSGVRERSASVATGPARPVINMEDISSGKLSPSKRRKRGNGDKGSGHGRENSSSSGRPSITNATFFDPVPVAPATPELTDAVHTALGNEKTSKLPADDVMAELLRVLNSTKPSIVVKTTAENKYLVKCSCTIDSESVKFDCEVVNVVKDTELKAIQIKRISGDVWTFKKVYQSITAGLVL
eukprot:TRINITY_DN354_c0_g1_i2.p1 TRINITY_DN354_c0_g1~~TRINITY_DN354_c0_g1_i2.p1  ORF type:complete len:614 (-),score=137.51 TRINITY_DN354_c0_g1_i2:935-2776(-)